jgi:hypothetical protein
MTCTFFPSYLEGDAEKWYHSVSDNMKTSVSRIKDVLFTRYCPSKLSVELIDINQSETETVDEYIHRVLKQCADTDMSDISKMTKAMKSLKPALGNTMYCYSSGPSKHGINKLKYNKKKQALAKLEKCKTSVLNITL